MMNVPLFLARRFYRATSKDHTRNASRLALRIATAGVAVGLVVMILSVCIVQGFQKEIRTRLAGFASHIEVMDLRALSSPESYPVALDKPTVDAISQLPHVMHVAPVSMKMGIFKTDEAFQTIALKGIDATYDTCFIAGQIIEGRLPAIATAADTAARADEIAISRIQKEKMKLKVGDKVLTYFVSDRIRMRPLKIVGVYETHLSGFDNHIVWTDKRLVDRLNNWTTAQCASLEIMLDHFESIEAVQPRIKHIVDRYAEQNGSAVATLSVKENPRTAAVVQWLSLLDFNVWVILILMAGVAGFTMISGLLILILERTQTIGVLRALGATRSKLRHTFILYATHIVVRGLVWGNVIALAFVAAQRQWGIIRLDPENYYVDVAPVSIDWLWIVGLNIATLAVCVLAMILPSFIISRIQPAKAIKYE